MGGLKVTCVSTWCGIDIHDICMETKFPGIETLTVHSMGNVLLNPEAKDIELLHTWKKSSITAMFHDLTKKSFQFNYFCFIFFEMKGTIKNFKFYYVHI